MGEANGKPVQSEQETFRIAGSGFVGAHITVNRVEGPAVKHLQYRQVGDVAGMDNDITGLETLCNLLFETVVRPDQVRICKHPRSDQHAFPAWFWLRDGDNL